HTRFSRDWSSDVCSSDLHLHIRSADTYGRPSELCIRLADCDDRLAYANGPFSNLAVWTANDDVGWSDFGTRSRGEAGLAGLIVGDRKSTRLNSSHVKISY